MVLNCKEVTESIPSDQLLQTGWWHRLAVSAAAGRLGESDCVRETDHE